MPSNLLDWGCPCRNTSSGPRNTLGTLRRSSGTSRLEMKNVSNWSPCPTFTVGSGKHFVKLPLSLVQQHIDVICKFEIRFKERCNKRKKILTIDLSRSGVQFSKQVCGLVLQVIPVESIIFKFPNNWTKKSSLSPPGSHLYRLSAQAPSLCSTARVQQDVSVWQTLSWEPGKNIKL